MRCRVARSVRGILSGFAAAILCAPAVAQEPSGKVPERSTIPVEQTWDLTHLYADQKAWEADFAACEEGIEQLAAMQGKVSQSPESLLAFLELRDSVVPRLEKVYVYAMLLKDQDTRESAPQALFDRCGTIAVKLGEALAWFEPEILALPKGQLMAWCQQTPELKVYTHAFDDLLRQQAHVLSAREEELLAMAGKVMSTPQRAFSMLTDADLRFPMIEDSAGAPVEMSEGRYMLYMQSPDRSLRERAFKALMTPYLDHKNTIATTYAGSVQGDVFRARARRYDSSLHAALDPDNVPVEVYHSLIATIREHLPKLHRYMDIRRAQLGIDRVHIYDTFIPLIEGEAPRIEYPDAVATILRGLAPLGPEYLGPMKHGFESRWIDVHETQGKRSGAYSAGVYAAPHPYILLNYNNTYDEMFTVAHEMGHSMHTWFTVKRQPFVYGDYPIFLAEVASTCNEIILADDLRKRATADAERLFLVNKEIEDIRGTVITQTMWADFELRVHEMAERGEPLTYDTIAQVYGETVRDYFGPAWGHDDEVDGYWLRIPHFYRAYYVYKYATSYCASVALAKGVLSGDPAKLSAYLGFLKAGSSDYPINILKRAGVDMSTSEPIHQTMQLFGELLDELDHLLSKQPAAAGVR